MINLDKKHTLSQVDSKLGWFYFKKSKFDGAIRLITDVDSKQEVSAIELLLKEVGLEWDRMWVL
jgi:hypothetical protein